MNTNDEILKVIQDILHDLFELEAEQLTGNARLYEDLDIDSIDAVDLLIELKKVSGKTIKPEQFQHVKTIDDVINVITENSAI